MKWRDRTFLLKLSCYRYSLVALLKIMATSLILLNETLECEHSNTEKKGQRSCNAIVRITVAL